MTGNDTSLEKPVSEGPSGLWRPVLTSSKLLALAILAAAGGTVAAETAGMFPVSILRPGTIAYVLFGIAALCFLMWLALASTGLIRKKSTLRQASTAVLGLSLLIFAVMMVALILFSDEVKAIVLHSVIMACVIILPPSLFFVFLAMRKQSLLNSFITNLARLGMLDRRRSEPLQRPESEACRLARIRSYFERFAAHYGLTDTSTIVQFVVAMQDEDEDASRTAQAEKHYLPFLDLTAKAPVYDVKTVLPVILSVVPVTIGWLIVLPPRPLGGASAPGSPLLWIREPVVPELSAVGFAFLGAYFFSLQMLVRRFITRDLAPNAYTQMSQRIILALIAAWLLAHVVQHGLDLSDRQLYATAFVLGAFPAVVWEVLAQAVKRALGAILRIPSLQTGRPLGQLSGLTVWHELRLEEEDVENVETMASADMIEMMLSTKFPPHRIIDWIDEALLRLSLPPIPVGEGRRKPHPLEFLLALYGIRTATGLVSAYYGSVRAGAANLQPMLGPDVMNVLHPIVAEVMLQPNFRNVAHWKRLPQAVFEDLDARIGGDTKRKEVRPNEEARFRRADQPPRARITPRAGQAGASPGPAARS